MNSNEYKELLDAYVNQEKEEVTPVAPPSEHKKHMIRSIAIRVYSQAIAANPRDPKYRAILSIDYAKTLVDVLEKEGLL